MVAVPTDPIPGEGMLGLISRAAAANGYRTLYSFLKPGGLRIGPTSFLKIGADTAVLLAKKMGTTDVEGIERLFCLPVEGRPQWTDFFGTPIRSIYISPGTVRRIAPGRLGNLGHIPAMWSLRVFGFDPVSKEKLIDTCPVCHQRLGWKASYGIFNCDNCVKWEDVGGFDFVYPTVDLRDFPQPRVDVPDEEALDFVTGLVDPCADRRDAARKLIPDYFARFSSSDLFEAIIAIAFALTQAGTRKKNAPRFTPASEPGRRFDGLTPALFCRAGRAIMGGREGLTELVETEFATKCNDEYPSRRQLGQLTTLPIDRNLDEGLRRVIAVTVDEAAVRRRDTAKLTITALAQRFEVRREWLGNIAASGVVPIYRKPGLIKGPLRMAADDVAGFIEKHKDAIATNRIAAALGIAADFLPGLAERGLVDEIRLFGAPHEHYSRRSLRQLQEKVAAVVKAAAEGSTPLFAAFALVGAQSVDWAVVVEAVVAGRITVVTTGASKRLFRAGLAVPCLDRFRSEIAGLNEAMGSAQQRISIGRVADTIGCHVVAAYKLVKAGYLTRYDATPNPFKMAEVREFAGRYIHVPEIRRLLGTKSYKASIAWLSERKICPEFELAHGKWLFFDRIRVEKMIEDAHLPEEIRRSEEDRWISQNGIDISEVAGILRLGENAVASLAAAGWLYRKDRWFAREEVQKLALRYIFFPEIRERFSSETTRRTNIVHWLKTRGVAVAFVANHGRVTAFDRSAIESLKERTFEVDRTIGTHPPAIRRRLIRLVEKGMPISQAAIAVSVSRATATKWVVRWKREGKIPLTQKARESVQSHLPLLCRIVANDRRQSIPAIIAELQRHVDVDADYRGVYDVITRNQIGWIGSKGK
jgi:transposase